MKENEVRFGKSIAVVTGGAGFIGAALCARLCDMGFGEVIAIDNLRSGYGRDLISVSPVLTRTSAV